MVLFSIVIDLVIPDDVGITAVMEKDDRWSAALFSAEYFQSPLMEIFAYPLCAAALLRCFVIHQCFS